MSPAEREALEAAALSAGDVIPPFDTTPAVSIVLPQVSFF